MTMGLSYFQSTFFGLFFLQFVLGKIVRGDGYCRY